MRLIIERQHYLGRTLRSRRRVSSYKVATVGSIGVSSCSRLCEVYTRYVFACVDGNRWKNSHSAASRSGEPLAIFSAVFDACLHSIQKDRGRVYVRHEPSWFDFSNNVPPMDSYIKLHRITVLSTRRPWFWTTFPANGDQIIATPWCRHVLKGRQYYANAGRGDQQHRKENKTSRNIDTGSHSISPLLQA